jgi:hypothetical protein
MFENFHPFYFYAALIWLVLVVIRTLTWQYRPVAKCERCGAVGRVHNLIRGSWKREMIRFVLFVPIGFFLHILMGLYLSYFLTRWFVIRECAVCQSEALDFENLSTENAIGS